MNQIHDNRDAVTTELGERLREQNLTLMTIHKRNSLNSWSESRVSASEKALANHRFGRRL